VGLRPADMRDITAAQLLNCVPIIDALWTQK
jgi:hypothetical protein